MRIWKNRWFARFADDENISDKDLCAAIARAERGLIDADLGGGVIKQRIARPGQGRSGGFRTIVFFRAETCCVFAYGFAKNRKDNISDNDLQVFRTVAGEMLFYSGQQFEDSVTTGELIEVQCNEQNLQK